MQDAPAHPFDIFYVPRMANLDVCFCTKKKIKQNTNNNNNKNNITYPVHGSGGNSDNQSYMPQKVFPGSNGCIAE